LRIAELREAKWRLRSFAPLDVGRPTRLEVPSARTGVHGPTHSVDLAEVEVNDPLQVGNPPSTPILPLFGIQLPHLPEHLVESNVTSCLQASIRSGKGRDFELFPVHGVEQGLRNQNFDPMPGRQSSFCGSPKIGVILVGEPSFAAKAPLRRAAFARLCFWNGWQTSHSSCLRERRLAARDGID
jgi:hypothetical protein